MKEQQYNKNIGVKKDGSLHVSLSEEACNHKQIENNMVPDTCRNCGKVLIEPKEETWEEEFVRKFFVYKLGDKFADHVGAEKHAVDFIRSVRQQAIAETIRELMDLCGSLPVRQPLPSHLTLLDLYNYISSKGIDINSDNEKEV